MLVTKIEPYVGDLAKRHLPTWREMNMDTSPEAEAVLFKLWRDILPLAVN